MATDTGYLNYILSNPDLRENAEAAGLTQAEMIVMGRTHWEGGGKNEGRLNSPDAQDFAPGFTQTLGPEHYQGRDVEDVLQASVRAGDPSEMWGAREDISPDWNLGQYTAEGWNMAADQPYGTGILANQIEVNPDIGQLVPTTAAGNVGNLNFIQDRYLDTALANDFPAEWVTNNAWTGPENLGGYWEDLTSATRDDVGILGRVDPYDPTTAARPSTVVGPRGTVTGGPPNPTVPSFGYPQYQDWTRFMPTNFQLAEGGGMHYQPGAWGNIPVTAGGGGPFVARPDPIMINMGDYPGGGTTATGGPGPINPNIWGGTDTTGGGNTVTDSSGNRWVMSPGGQWIPAGSDYANALSGTGPYSSSLDPNFYDSSGAFMGAEGNSYDKMGFEIDRFTGQRTGAKINDSFGIGDKILGFMGAWPAQVQRDKAAWTGGLTANQIGAMNAANAAQAGTGYADMFGGTNYEGHIGADPTAAGFIDWDQ